MRARLAVLAVAGLIAVLGVTAITASGAGHEAEVRITAHHRAAPRQRAHGVRAAAARGGRGLG